MQKPRHRDTVSARPVRTRSRDHRTEEEWSGIRMAEWIFADCGIFMPGMIQREVLPDSLLTNLDHTTESAV